MFAYMHHRLLLPKPINSTKLSLLIPLSITMDPNSPNTHQQSSSQALQVIEFARRRSHDSYHSPESIYLLPFFTPCFDPYIASRMQALYADHSQTQRHQNTFFAVKYSLAQQGSTSDDDDGLSPDNRASELPQIYDRVLNLYDNRSSHIQRAGAQRISLWSQSLHEQSKPAFARSDAFVAACTSPLAFLEEDHQKRKLEFVTEVYSLLEKRDPEHAEMVLGDLGQIWPGETINQVRVLREYVVDYAHVRVRRAFVRRGREWGRGEFFPW